MRLILLWSLIIFSGMAGSTYEKGKIDTHGGKYDNLNGKKETGFSQDVACMSDFLNKDKNSSKKSSK